MQPLVLIVDDDPHLREVVRFALEKGGFRTAEAADGREAVTEASRLAPDLVVLDVLMPEMDGTEACRQIRASSSVPIVFLSSRDEDVDRIVGLELGGDDYVTKPFSPRELVARVRAVLRRASSAATTTGAAHAPGEAPSPRLLRHGRLEVDVDAFRASWDGRDVVLTATEFGIVRTLLARPDKVYRREELMDRAYDEHNVVSDRTIDSHVRRVRQKFAAVGADPIETVHGVGYRLAPPRP